jgi:hypothetical protein
MKFDMKKFLSSPLNDGSTYWNYDDGCGCVKSVFNESLEEPLVYRSKLSLTETADPGPFMAVYGSPTCYVGQPIGGEVIKNINKKLKEVLDVGEHILIKGYPQKAKLYVAHMLEKFNLVELINTEVEVKECQTSQI